MPLDYLELIWFGGIVIVLTSAALIGLWRRENPDIFQPAEPVLLSPAERQLFRQDRTATLQAKKAARKAKRQEITRSRRRGPGAKDNGAKDNGDVKS